MIKVLTMIIVIVIEIIKDNYRRNKDKGKLI
jgi:hypothetical protein